MIKAIIFDFDGVIIDSEKLRYETYQELFLQKFRKKIPKNDSLFLGRKQEENIKELLNSTKEKGDINELTRLRNKLIQKKFNNLKNIIPVKGIFQFLIKMKRNNMKLAIGSGAEKGYIERVLKQMDIQGFFNVILASEDTKKVKPNPEIFLKIAKKLNINPKECLVIEDSINGILAGKSAGMCVIGLTTTLKKEVLNLADKTFDNFESIDVSGLEIE